MRNLLRIRHALNSARYSPRICVQLFSPCHFLAPAPINRTDSVPATRRGVS
jgi:hypothetical protein